MSRCALVLPFLMLGCGVVQPVEEPDELDSAGQELSRIEAGWVLISTTDVNLRSGPAKTFSVLDVVDQGAEVTVVSASTGAYVEVSYGGRTGFSHRDYYRRKTAPVTDAVRAIDDAATGSACFRYPWKNRGQMPRGYIKGVARVFARSLCEPARADIVVASRAATSDTGRDALAWYSSTFAAQGMSNAASGAVTLRHTYALLLGLGMRESSGEHCVGRDMSASNFTASTCEAGAWQTSYDSRGAHAQLPVLFEAYRAGARQCHLSAFADGVSCSSTDWKNWGTGDGVTFQRLEKECPAFAAEYAAVMLRVAGGSSGHYGPLRTRAAEVRPECDQLLKDVQAIVASNPSVCSSL